MNKRTLSTFGLLLLLTAAPPAHALEVESVVPVPRESSKHGVSYKKELYVVVGFKDAYVKTVESSNPNCGH